MAIAEPGAPAGETAAETRTLAQFATADQRAPEAHGERRPRAPGARGFRVRA